MRLMLVTTFSYSLTKFCPQSNIKIQCRRLELSLQDLKQRMEITRQRLAAEKEVRFSAVLSCKYD